MKPVFGTLALIVGLSFSMSGQDKTYDFGNVTPESFAMTSYPKDPEAAAVVLSDVGNTVFVTDYDDLRTHFTRTRRVQILSDEGIDQVSTVYLPYYIDTDANYERFISIKAATYNLQNGIVAKTSLNPDDIYDERPFKHRGYKVFTFPNVKKGSILEYEFELESPYIFNLPDWEFQTTIPTLYSRYSVAMVPFYEYTYILQGANQFHSHTSTELRQERAFANVRFFDLQHTFVMRDLPAFKDEGYITAMHDYIIKIDFQLCKFTNQYGVSKDILTTWPKLIKELLDHQDFGKFQEKAVKHATGVLSSQLKAEGETLEQRIKNIVDYLKLNYTWNQLYGYFASGSFKDFTTRRTGSMTELNLMLCGFLNAAGIEAYPVLLSTRDHGKVWVDYPFHHFFNTIIVAARQGDQHYLLDCTDPLLPYNRIPQECIHEVGLVIEPDTVRWLDLNVPVESAENVSLSLTCSPSTGILHASISQRSTEYEALVIRHAKKDSSAMARELIGPDVIEMQSYETQNLTDPEKPAIVKVKGTLPLQGSDDLLFISPFLHHPITENPFKQKARKHPIDFVYKKSRQLLCVLDIPEGYSVLESPAHVKIDDKVLKMDYTSEQLGNKLKVTAFVSFKKSLYGPEDYTLIKQQFDLMISKFNEHIVLKKG
jgi:hypothetical protein